MPVQLLVQNNIKNNVIRPNDHCYDTPRVFLILVRILCTKLLRQAKEGLREDRLQEQFKDSNR